MKTGTVFIRLLAKTHPPLTFIFPVTPMGTTPCAPGRKLIPQVQEAWPPAGVWGKAPRL